MTPLERIAHDVICIVKYGSPSGSVNSADLKRVAEYLDACAHCPSNPSRCRRSPSSFPDHERLPMRTMPANGPLFVMGNGPLA